MLPGESSKHPNGHPITALVTKLETTPDIDRAAFANWLVKLLIAAAQSPGFWSGEIIPPPSAAESQWKLIQWFCTAEQANDWCRSESRATVIGECSALLPREAVTISDEIGLEEWAAGVATAIVTEVKAGMKGDYWRWEQKIQSAQAKYPGYRGVYLAPPAPGRTDEWTTLLRFDSPASLETWFASEERTKLLAEANQLVKSTHIQNLSSSYPGWFPSDQETGKQPPRWKTAVLVLLSLFPVVLTLRRYFLPLLGGINTTAAIAINSVFSVALVSWVAMPFFVRLFKWWLLPKYRENFRKEIAGIALAICVFAGEITLLWNLFPEVIK